MKPTKLVRKERILEYLDNISRQIEDIQSIPVPLLAAMKKIPDLALVVPRVWGNRLSLER
jgi:hypothetical protein